MEIGKTAQGYYFSPGQFFFPSESAVGKGDQGEKVNLRNGRFSFFKWSTLSFLCSFVFVYNPLPEYCFAISPRCWPPLFGLFGFGSGGHNSLSSPSFPHFVRRGNAQEGGGRKNPTSYPSAASRRPVRRSERKGGGKFMRNTGLFIGARGKLLQPGKASTPASISQSFFGTHTWRAREQFLLTGSDSHVFAPPGQPAGSSSST